MHMKSWNLPSLPTVAEAALILLMTYMKVLHVAWRVSDNLFSPASSPKIVSKKVRTFSAEKETQNGALDVKG